MPALHCWIEKTVVGVDGYILEGYTTSATSQTLAIGARMYILAIVSILASVWFEKKSTDWFVGLCRRLGLGLGSQKFRSWLTMVVEHVQLEDPLEVRVHKLWLRLLV